MSTQGAKRRLSFQLRATAAAYVRFATKDAAMLELMFAGKHREESGALHEAADRHLTFESRQRCTQTKMDAAAEAHVSRRQRHDDCTITSTG